MQSSYTPFDAVKFTLGSLCGRGHDWNGTGQSLRRIKTKGPSTGKAGACVNCQAASNAENADAIRANKAIYRAIHIERDRAREAARYAANREKIRANVAVYRSANLDKIRAYDVARYAADPAKRRARHAVNLAAWQAANPDKVRAANHRRRDRKAAALALQHLTAAQSRQRLQDFGNTCAFCGATENLHLDHFLPLSMGNALTLGNAIPACQRCNGSKSTVDPWEWYSRQPFFSQKRWDRILKVLGKKNHHHGQMVLV
jgi:5-methylcytosine-specific restriction endonuclease McrA